MDISLAIILAGAAVAGLIQGLSGFAFGLVSMSFWAWIAEPSQTATMAVFGALIGQIVAMFSLRPQFSLRKLLPYLIGGLAGIPFGVLLLPVMDPYMFKATLGLLLAVWCPLMLLLPRLPRVQLDHPLADGTVGWIGGLMSGLSGIAGAIPTLWCNLRHMDKDQQRAIIQTFNLTMLAVTMAGYLLTGTITRETWPMLASIAPVVILFSFLGTKLYLGISPAAFRRIVLSLLTLSGITLLGSAFHHYIG